MRLATLILALFLQGVTIPGPGNTHAGFPPNVYAGLQAWYRADHTLCGGTSCADGGMVTQWTDGSPNQNNATGCNPGAIYHVSQINSQPAVTFASDCYAFSAPINLQTASTIFIVYLINPSGTLISGNAFSLSLAGGAGSEQVLSKLSVGTLVSGTALPDMAWHEGTATYDGTTAALLLDGSPDGTNTPSVAITANETGIGRDMSTNSDYLSGQVAEIIIYNRVLSGGELASVRSYLFARYGF